MLMALAVIAEQDIVGNIVKIFLRTRCPKWALAVAGEIFQRSLCQKVALGVAHDNEIEAPISTKSKSL